MDHAGFYGILIPSLFFTLKRFAGGWHMLAPRDMGPIRRIATLDNPRRGSLERAAEKLQDAFSHHLGEGLPFGSAYFRLVTLRLERAGVEESPMRFTARKLLYPLIVLAMGGGVSLVVRDVPAVAYFFKGFAVVFALGCYRLPDAELNRLRDKRDERLVLELPRLIRTIRYSPENKPLVAIVRDYLKIAKGGLSKDLERLLSDLELNVSEDRALRDFAERLATPEAREMVGVLRITLEVSRKDSQVSLMFIEDKLAEKARQIVQKELSRRPEILEMINDILLYALGLIFLVPMIVTMFRGFALFLQ